MHGLLVSAMNPRTPRISEKYYVEKHLPLSKIPGPRQVAITGRPGQALDGLALLR